MKRSLLNILIVFSILIFSHIAQSARFVLNDEKSLADLMLMTKEGQFIGGTSFDLTYRSSTYKYLEEIFFTDEVSENSFSQIMAYGATERIAPFIRLSYTTKQTEKIRYGSLISSLTGQEFIYLSSGLKDPELGGKGRILEQKDYKFNLDLEALYSPKIINAVTATDKKKGNVARGGSAYSLQVTGGQKFTKFEYLGGVYYTFFNKRTARNAGNGEVTKGTSYSLYGFKGEVQFHLTEKLYLPLFVNIVRQSSTEYQNTTTGSKTKYGSTSATRAGAGLKYNIIPERLIIGGELGGMSAADQQVVLDISGTRYFGWNTGIRGGFASLFAIYSF